MSDAPGQGPVKSIMPTWVRGPQDFIGGIALMALAAGGGFEITLKKQITVPLDARNWTLFNQNHSSNGQEYSGGLAIFF